MQLLKDSSIAQTIELKRKVEHLISFGKSLCEPWRRPFDCLELIGQFAAHIAEQKCDDPDRIRSFKRCTETSFVGQIVRLICNLPNPNEQESIYQVVIVTAQADIVCLQVHDPNYFIKASFPPEGSKVICDSLLLQNVT